MSYGILQCPEQARNRVIIRKHRKGYDYKSICYVSDAYHHLDIFTLIFAFSTLLVHLGSNIFLNFAVT